MRKKLFDAALAEELSEKKNWKTDCCTLVALMELWKLLFMLYNVISCMFYVTSCQVIASPRN